MPVIVENILSNTLTIPCHAISQLPVNTPVKNVIIPSNTPKKPVITTVAILIAVIILFAIILAVITKPVIKTPPKNAANA